MVRGAGTLIGYNNNISYRGHRFHLQTEDSGRDRPHILTHLFADGGYIVKSVRSEYAQYVDHPDRTRIVAQMMKKQHLEVALQLRDGHLDAKIEHLVRAASIPAPTTTLEDEPEVTKLDERPEIASVFGFSQEESLDELILNYVASFQSSPSED